MSEDIKNNTLAAESKDKVYAEIVAKLGQKREVSVLGDYSPEDIVATLYELRKYYIFSKYQAILKTKATEVENRSGAFMRDYNDAVMQIPAAQELKKTYDEKLENLKKALQEEFDAELLNIEGVGELRAELDRQNLELLDGYENDKKLIEAEYGSASSGIVVGDSSVKVPIKQWLTRLMEEILHELDAIRGIGSEAELSNSNATKEVEGEKLDVSNKKLERNMTNEVKEEEKADTADTIITAEDAAAMGGAPDHTGDL